MPSTPSTIVITGASAGIGRAIAMAFASEGARLGLIARCPEALEQVKTEVERNGGKALVLRCDVSDAAAVEGAAERVEARFGPIDIWVNCAMVTIFSAIKDIDPAEYRRVTDVTYHGCVFGTMAALKRMRLRNKGHIIQVGSALAYRSIPLQSAYCGAKHALRGFTDSLRSELIHENLAIKVSMVQLPAFNTPQFRWARNHMGKIPGPLPPIHNPALAAEAILWIAKHPQREVWVGVPSWKAIIGHSLFPGLLDRYLAHKAWEGQFAGGNTDPRQRDNLFESVYPMHSTEGPFGDQAISKRPILWHLKNQRLWINGSLILIFAVAFLLGWVLAQ